MKKIALLLCAMVYATISFAQNDVVKFQADIANRSGDVLYIKNGKVIVKEVKVEGDGHFSTSFNVTEGIYQFTFDGSEYSELYLKNGYDLKLKMDVKDFDKSIVYSGKGAKENNFLAKRIISDGDYNYDALLTLTPEEFAKKTDEKTKADMASLDGGKLDANFVALEKKRFEDEMTGLKKYYNYKLEKLKLNNTQSPSFEFTNHAGGTTKLEDLRGKYVYIDVWATWCGPCRGEIPHLAKIEEKYHGKNIEFVSISVDVEKDVEKWKTFVTDKKLGGTQLIADKNWNSDFIKAYGINSIPRFILIDPTGKIVSADADRPSNPQLQEQLDGLLK